MNRKGGNHITEKSSKAGRKPLPPEKKRKEVKAYILPDLVSWYLSEGLGNSFTEILESIAKERGYKEGDGKRIESKQNKPSRRSQPFNSKPSASYSTVISE